MAKSESQNLEFKETWRDEWLKTICAFANTNGGSLHVGITDKGDVKGLEDSKKMLEDIPNKIKENLSVVANVSCKKKNKLEYLTITIKQYQFPISYKGKYYIRSGSTTRELNGPDLQQFLLSKSTMSWESMKQQDATFDDIDVESIDAFRAQAEKKSLPAGKETDNTKLLNKLHLVTEAKPTHGAVLLFGKDPQQFHPAAVIKLVKFSKDNAILVSDEIRGNLLKQAEQVMEVLKSKYLISGVVIQGLYRHDELEYPEAALREAIINAIAHRDYTGGYTQIKVYPDKLTIWNNGELPSGLPIDLLKQDHPSKPRNKDIANTLRAYGLIEGWGIGTTKMIIECINAGLLEPIFEEFAGGFQVTFSKKGFTLEFLRMSGLNERQITAVEYLQNNGSINNQTYQSITGSIKRTATRDLNELVEKKIVERSGSTGKGTAYNLIGYKPTGIVKSTNPSDGTETLNDLDKKLESLDQKLQLFDPEDEIRDQFNKDVLRKIVTTWWADILREVVPVIQRFNRYFVDPGHWTNLPNPLGGYRFKDESPDDVIKSVIEQFDTQIKNHGQQYIRYEDTSATIQTSYGTFRKAGLDTFGCNYFIEVKFSQNWYEVLVDDQVMQRNRKLLFKRQYHKPVTHEEARMIAKNFGNLIYSHIELAIDQIQKSKGDNKGTKETSAKKGDVRTSNGILAKTLKKINILGKWQMKDSTEYALEFTNYGIVIWTHLPYAKSQLKYTWKEQILTVGDRKGTVAFSNKGNTLKISGFANPDQFATEVSGPYINGTYVRR